MQGSKLHKELRDEAYCISMWFVTVMQQYFVVLGATNCTYPFGPLYLVYSLNNKASTLSMHIRDVSQTGSRLIYILMQEDTFCNTNKPCVTLSYMFSGFSQCVGGCRLSTKLLLPKKWSENASSFHRPCQSVTTEDERNAQLKTCLSQNSCRSAVPSASFTSLLQRPKDIICGPAMQSQST